MDKVYGKTVCYIPRREDDTRTIISFGREQVDKEHSTWYEVYFYKKQHPVVTQEDVKEAIKAAVDDIINSQTRERILSGFVWHGKNVWLSSENQFNFNAAYALAIQTNGKSLPMRFKLGEAEKGVPVYHTFEDMEEFTDFHAKMIAFIGTCLNEGWEKKDGTDWSIYDA